MMISYIDQKIIFWCILIYKYFLKIFFKNKFNNILLIVYLIFYFVYLNFFMNINYCSWKEC